MKQKLIKLTELPPKVYLTLGSLEQVQFLLGKKVKLLFEPTTQEMREEIQTSLPYDNSNVVIWPKITSTTGLIKKTGQIKLDNRYAIPTDQFVKIAEDKKVFILFCGYDGVVRNADVTAAKKIEGGDFELLDLRKQNLVTGDKELDDSQSAFPITLLYKKNQLAKICDYRDFVTENHTQSDEFQLVKSLTSLEGVEAWGRLSQKDITRYFCIPGMKFPLLLSKARAWALLPYLQPFIEGSENGEIISAARLQSFALWVFFSSTYWTTYWEKGLSTYKPEGKSEYFTFKPSVLSRRMWRIILQGDLQGPLLKKKNTRINP